MNHCRIPVVEALEEKALLSHIGVRVRVPTPPAPPVTVGPVTSQGLKIRLTTDHAVYHPGQPVVMTLTMTNTSSHNVSVGLGPSVDGFSVTQQGNEVWASNTGPQPLFILLKKLRPGGSTTLSATWNGHSNIGSPSTPTGTLVVHSQIVGAQPVTIQILPS